MDHKPDAGFDHQGDVHGIIATVRSELYPQGQSKSECVPSTLVHTMAGPIPR